MIDAPRLLKDLQRLLGELEADLRVRCGGHPAGLRYSGGRGCGGGKGGVGAEAGHGLLGGWQRLRLK